MNTRMTHLPIPNNLSVSIFFRAGSNNPWAVNGVFPSRKPSPLADGRDARHGECSGGVGSERASTQDADTHVRLASKFSSAPMNDGANDAIIVVRPIVEITSARSRSEHQHVRHRLAPKLTPLRLAIEQPKIG